MSNKKEDLKKQIISYFKSKKINNYENLNKEIFKFYKKISNNFNNIPYYYIDNIVKSYYNYKPQFNNNNDNMFREIDKQLETDEINNNISIPKKYNAKQELFMKLYNTPQPEQKSKEWFDYRKTRITASVTSAAISENPYESVENFILAKCDDNHPFRDTILTKHGVKYEQIATMLYEHVYNVIITEFGCLPSKKESFLGASPDGICSKLTLNGKFCKLLGKMLEIKCPLKRKFYNRGKIRGQICPNYYWWQTQQQLYCCGLDSCDFWQCDIKEYKNRQEFINDDITPIVTYGTEGKQIMVDKRVGKGCIVELYPINFVPRWTKEDVINDKYSWEVNGYEKADCPYFQAQYIYPPRLNMTLQEWDEWVLHIVNNWKEMYPDFATKYYIHKIIYYKIPFSHNVEIKKEEDTFKAIIPLLKKTMNDITTYKKNPKLLKKLKEKAKIISKFKKNMKTNSMGYSIANKKLLASKKDFLQKIEIETPFI
jgi:putative phage-type endonuclease